MSTQLIDDGGLFMQYDYYYHVGQTRLAALRQEAEHEHLAHMAQQGMPKVYRHWATWPGRAMRQSGQQLVQFGNRGQSSIAAASPRHAALPTTSLYTLKAAHMQPERRS
jgi:hypothetical protein